MDVILFGSRVRNYWLSNFHQCELDLLGMKFSSVDQVYQWTKAFVLPSSDLSEKYCNAIMSTDSPAECKKLARNLFSETEIMQCKGSTHWDKIKTYVIIRLACAKFLQHPFLKNQLLDTGEAVLVEALRDKFWGAGTSSEAQIRDCVHKNSNFSGQNMMGHLLEEVRAYLQEGHSSARPVLVVGDSLLHGIGFSSSCHVVSWAGSHIVETIKLAAAMCHSGVMIVVLLVGTNDLPADPPHWQLPAGKNLRKDSDGALLRTSPNRMRARYMAALNIFFQYHPLMRVIVCELLPRHCDPPTSSNGLSRIQKGVKEVNTVLANSVVPHFAKDHLISLLPLYDDFTELKLFKTNNGVPSLHLNKQGTETLKSKLSACLANYDITM